MPKPVYNHTIRLGKIEITTTPLRSVEGESAASIVRKFRGLTPFLCVEHDRHGDDQITIRTYKLPPDPDWQGFAKWLDGRFTNRQLVELRLIA